MSGYKAKDLAISCRSLHKRFGDVVAVESVDLEVLRGECFGLLGPNGAGKTTTIEILEGLQKPDGGDVQILGQRWEENGRDLRSRLGIQLQETELPDRLTVRETIALFRSVYSSGREVDDLLDLVELRDKADSQVRFLSGGQKQRLSLACALAGDPDILFLDEPTTGLDPQARRHIWDLCREFQAEGGTILLTTHFMDEAEKLADRLAILDRGSVLVEGTPAHLKATLGGEHVVEVTFNGEIPQADLESLFSVSSVTLTDHSFRLTTPEPHSAIAALYRLLDGRSDAVTSLNTHQATLDDVFLALTGRQLREG